MVYVALCTQNKKNNLLQCISSALSEYGGVINIDVQSIECTVDKPQFCVINRSKVPLTTKGIKGVIVIGDNVKPAFGKKLSTDMPCIVNSSNRRAIAAAANTQTRVITCGTSSKDTISLASFSDGNAIVSLQREITDVFGNTIEPMDITVKIDENANINDVVYTCAVLVLCGKFS